MERTITRQMRAQKLLALKIPNLHNLRHLKMNFNIRIYQTELRNVNTKENVSNSKLRFLKKFTIKYSNFFSSKLNSNTSPSHS